MCCCFTFHHPALLSAVFIHNCCNTVITHVHTQHSALPPYGGKPVEIVCRRESEGVKAAGAERRRRDKELKKLLSVVVVFVVDVGA